VARSRRTSAQSAGRLPCMSEVLWRPCRTQVFATRCAKAARPPGVMPPQSGDRGSSAETDTVAVRETCLRKDNGRD
jgi:hypothetical protein